MPRIMIVEDDHHIVEAVEKILERAGGYSLCAIRDPDKAVGEAIDLKPDLILLDVKLPGADGRQIIKLLKENVATRAIPVIFLTGMSGEGDKVIGLNLGADDYVVKPFGAMELLARIQAVLRRAAPQPDGREIIEAAGLVLDVPNRAASFKGRSLKLQPKEFEILYLLASQPGRAHTRGYLIDNTSSYGMAVGTRSLDTHIKNIRRKLGKGGSLIETLPKLGYRFSPPPHGR